MTPFEKIELFKSKCVSAFEERLESLVLTGSYGRGDYTPQSDIDLWVFIKNLCLEDIQKVGDIVRELGKPPELNPQCTSFAEIRNDAFKDEFNPIQLYIDGIVIHGSLPGPIPSYSEVMSYASSIAVFALMSVRHYLAVKETEESLSKGKLLKWAMRPFVWALRYRVFCETSKCPRKLEDLMTSLTNTDEKEIVQIYSQILAGEFKGSYTHVVEKVEKATKDFINH